MPSSELRSLLRTTQKYVDILASHGIDTPADLLTYFPRAYEDRREIKTISQINWDESTQTIKARVTKKGMITTPRRKKLIEIYLEDEQGSTAKIQAINNTYLLRQVTKDQRYYIIGKPVKQGNSVVFWHPEISPATETEGIPYNVGKIYPIYSELSGIKPHRFTKKISPLLETHLSEIDEHLPESILEQYNLLSLSETVRTLHLPESLEQVEKAQYRRFFEQLLRMQLVSLHAKRTYQVSKKRTPPNRDLLKEFIDSLPFTLTWAQKRVLKQLIDDIHGGRSMMRLLQWDVWSGKTVVATAIAWYIIKLFDAQIAFLAPIEVLAHQHHHTLAKFLLPLGVKLELITWSTTSGEKERIKQALKLWHIDFIVGTHALIQEDIDFYNLQLAIIDEQHKFGVKQRAFFQRFDSPHLLQMSATPIPRSMALAFFGEFDVSNIDELPAGRKPITTKIITQTDYNKLKPRLLTKIDQGQRVFMITPLIEESDKLDEVTSATLAYQQVTDTYPELQGRIGLLHGKMRPADKEQVMQAFKSGKVVFLVSTTVVEVGIDIPEATVMIIKNAERFGLSQLHQLRWRVGRSDLQSYCFLQTSKRSGDTYERLQHMEATNDGFKLAEIDLKLRGAGEILGVRQSGETDIPLSILTDASFLETVQQAAQQLLDDHPQTAKRILQDHLSDQMQSMLV